MRLILSTTATEGDSAPQRHELNECRAVIGSADNADLRLDGLAAVSFLIDRDEKGQLAIFRKDPKQAIQINGRAFEGDRMDLRNGSTVTVGDREILVRVEFARVPQSSRSGMFITAVAVIVALILAAEVSIITWLPRKIEQSKLWATETLRQQTFYKLDNLRWRIRAILNSQKDPGKKDAYTGPTAELYKAEADRLAMFVREHHSNLTTDQLMRVKQDVDVLDAQAALLQQGKLIPPAQRIDVDAALNVFLPDTRKEHK